MSDGECVLCGSDVSQGSGVRRDVLDGNGFGRLNALICAACKEEREGPTDEEVREIEEEDNDPVCVCGVYRSEHAMMGCPEGFQTPAQWDNERRFIRSLDEDDYEAIYHPGEYR